MLSAYDYDILLRKKKFLIGEDQIQYIILQTVCAIKANFKLARQIELPPHSEVIINS